FGYDKSEFENIENETPAESKPRRKSRPVQDKFSFEELAQNYLLEEDEAILTCDVPERIQILEKKYNLKRDPFERGEFFLRFDLNEIHSETDLMLSIDNQREKQAEWVYFRMLENYLHLNGRT